MCRYLVGRGELKDRLMRTRKSVAGRYVFEFQALVGGTKSKQSKGGRQGGREAGRVGKWRGRQQTWRYMRAWRELCRRDTNITLISYLCKYLLTSPPKYT